jgi:hypothetical protein
VGSAAVVFSLAAENQAFEQRRRNFLLLSLLLAAIVAGVLVAIVRFQIVSRVAELAGAVRNLQHTGIMRPVVVNSHDELGFRTYHGATRVYEHTLTCAH